MTDGGGAPPKKKQTTVCVARAFFSRIFRAHPRFPRQNRPQFALRARCFFRAFSRSTAGVSSQVLASARAPQGRASVLLAHAPRRGGRRLRRPFGTRAAGWGSFFVRPLTKKTQEKIGACVFFRHVSMIVDWNCNAKWRYNEGIVRSHVRSLDGDAKCEKTEVPKFVQKSGFS